MAEPFQMYNFKLKDPRLFHYRCLVLKVVDGDTVMLLRDKGSYSYDVIKVRLAGVDAPERRPRAGTRAQQEHERKLAEATARRLESLIAGKEVIVRTEKTGKFDRWLGFIEVPGGELQAEIINLPETANQVLLDEGLAVVYGTPRPWREDEMRGVRRDPRGEREE
jgi:endonuclease YncB( thermonuclease family)